MNESTHIGNWIRALGALAVMSFGEIAVGAAFDADLAYVNATVITMDEDDRVLEAVAVWQGKIVAVGSNDEIHQLIGPQTRVRDLKGKTILPGFYAAHDHFPGSGTTALFRVDLNSPPIGKIETIQDLIAALDSKARRTAKGAWVVGRGYDDTLLKDRRHPTRADLDQVSTEHPIWIVHTSGHLGVANSAALQIAEVTRDTLQPRGGVIRKDPATGEPNGVFEECGYLVSRHIPGRSAAERIEAMRWAVRDYVEDGVTTTVIANGSKTSVEDLQQARVQNILPLRIITMISKSSTNASAAEAAGFITGFGDSWLKLGAIKMSQDGSNQGFTGYFTQPYFTPFKGDASYRGYPRRGRAALADMVKQVHRAGYQIAIHGNGDAAIDDILHALRQAQQDWPRNDARHRIEHCQYVREDQLDEIAELGITPSFFVGHVYYWGDRHRDIFLGPDRAAGISPLKSAARRDIRFTIHDDTPVTPVNPLRLVWTAVNRTTRSGKVLGPQQRVTVHQALRAVTIDAAWQNFEEDSKGSIEVGKLADFVILSDNPLTVDVANIKDLEVLETVVDGRTVFRR